jgi:hypothetical protein
VPDVGWRDVAVTAPVGLALVVAAAVLFVYRRAAPQGCRLAAATFLGLLAFHTAAGVAHHRLNRAVLAGDDAAILLYRYEVLRILSAIAHAGAVALLTVAVLSDRRRERAGPGD